MKKRGDSYTALIVAMIGASIILYILFLPPKYRAELLGENISRYGEDYSNVTILMSKEPGTLSYLKSDTTTLDLSSFNLYTKKTANILMEINSVYVRKSLFNNEFRNLTFELRNIDMLENVLLSFTASLRSGRLIIKLNDNIIMNRELETASPSPLELPKALLKENNVIVFEVSGPGIEFWKSNEYNLMDVRITGDIKDTSGQENRQVFVVTQIEKENLQYTELTFIPECSQAESNPMEIYLNKRLIYRGIPDCGLQFAPMKIEQDKILEGENHIQFISEEGNYLIYSAKIRLKLKEPVYPTYYFNLDSDRYGKIDDGKADINITLVFSNMIDYKKGIIIINGYETEVETYDNYYSRNINTFVRKDNNAVEIRPIKDKLDITQLEILYGEK